MPTTVTLFLKGSLVVFAKKGQSMGSVAILREPPPRHELKINFRVKPPGGSFGLPQPVFPVQDVLRIYVETNGPQTITLRKENAQINRLGTLTDQDSFKWFVDLENDELYGNRIDVEASAFKQILTFNSGELFAGNPLSYNELLVQRGNKAEYTPFGIVAGIIAVLFSAAQKVVFTNGGALVFDSSQAPAGTEYRIELENDALPNSKIVTDANHYYKAVGRRIPEDKKILFASVVESDRLKLMVDQQFEAILQEARETGDNDIVAALERRRPLGPPAGPEAACFPAYLSKTDL